MSKTYHVRKMEKDRILDFGGGFTEDDVKLIVNGYRKTDALFDGQFYQRKGSSVVYYVTEER